MGRARLAPHADDEEVFDPVRRFSHRKSVIAGRLPTVLARFALAEDEAGKASAADGNRLYADPECRCPAV